MQVAGGLAHAVMALGRGGDDLAHPVRHHSHGALAFGLEVVGFAPALLGALIVSVVSGLLSVFAPDKKKG